MKYLLLALVMVVSLIYCRIHRWWLQWAMEMYCRAFQRYAEDNQIPPITREQLVQYIEEESKTYCERMKAKLLLKSKSN